MRLAFAAVLLAVALPTAAQGIAAASPFPAGLYQPGSPAPPNARLLFDDEGAFEMSVDFHVIASGQYAATPAHLVLMFEADDETCARLGAKTGIYTWAETEGVVSLAVVDDACGGRAQALSSAPLARIGPGAGE